jgi:chloramphenicol O-acetyltransferase
MATIQYRTADGELGSFDSRDLVQIVFDPKTNYFTISQRFYGWDEYDFYNEEINDVTEVRI